MEAHVLITGGTGTGKTSAVLLPLLLNTGLPSFVIDVKGDLLQVLRERNTNFRVLDFRGTDWGYDPFALIRRETASADIGLVAQCLFPFKEQEDFWSKNARLLLQGLLTYYHSQGLDFNTSISEILGSDLQWQAKLAVSHNDPRIQALLGTLENMPEKTFGGIAAELVPSLVNLYQPELKRTFSIPAEHCVSPTDLLAGKSVIVRVPEDKIELYSCFLHLLVNQFLKFFEQQPDGHRPKVNLVLDEFYRLGKLESIQKASATLRSKGVRVIACCQSFAQLEELYGANGARVLADNFPFQIVLGAHDPNTQKYYSLKAGMVSKKQESFCRKGGQLTYSYHWEDAHAIKPEELGLLKDRNELIIFSPEGWMQLRKRPLLLYPIYCKNQAVFWRQAGPKAVPVCGGSG